MDLSSGQVVAAIEDSIVSGEGATWSWEGHVITPSAWVNSERGA